MAAAEVLAPYEQYLTRPASDVAADLDAFVALLLKWNKAQNLVSRETSDVWQRHVADSLQVLPLLHDSDRTVLDLGSGGGFPAVPLAVAGGGGRQFILVEPSAKKASFLRTVSRELGLALRVEARRTEEIAPAELPPVDVITSRALSSLKSLCNLALPFWGAQTRAIFHKGREHVDELAESSAVHYHDVLVHPSATDSSGVLLELTNLRLRHK